MTARGVQEAARPAARRRSMRLQGASSAGLALVLLLGLLAANGPAEPGAGADATIAGVAPPAPAAPARPPAARAPLQGRTSVTGPRREARAPVGAPSRRRRAAAAPAPAPAAVRSPAAQPAHRPMVRRYQREAHGESVCATGTGGTGVGLTCRDVGTRAAATGHLLSFRVCPTTAARFELSFATEAEVAMSVLDRGGRPVWTWRPGRPFGEHGHVLVSEVGACWLWETRWGQVDDAGTPLPDGRYTLLVDFLELEDTGTYTRSFNAR